MGKERPKIVIAGGGVAALEVLLGLRLLLGDDAEIALISPQDEFVYQPMAITEPFGGPAMPTFDLTDLLAEKKPLLVRDSLAAIDPVLRVATTTGGRKLEFDKAVVAIGALTEPVIERALTFIGGPRIEAMAHLLEEVDAGKVRRIAFVTPAGAVWPLPLYELALLTAKWIDERQIGDVELELITPEQAPLRLFGSAASQEVAGLLRRHKIRLRTMTHVAHFDGANLTLVPGKTVKADRVVAIPRLHGRHVQGLESDDNGFLRTDGHGLVSGTLDVYAAGDITNFPVKQGGIAAQQADAAVRAIAAGFGAPVEPKPFRPVLRGLLFTGDGHAFLRADISGTAGDDSNVSQDPLWPTGDKIVGQYLSGFLADHGLDTSA
ncbi:MAG: FAD-dependent oxidoreductase [Actinobacteria bacterium]|nr:FAD-dependent oxidoreductase [Actinomycetota bacterium]